MSKYKLENRHPEYVRGLIPDTPVCIAKKLPDGRPDVNWHPGVLKALSNRQNHSAPNIQPADWNKDCNEGNPDFAWPEFNSEKQRHKIEGQAVKNMSVVEAFEQMYGEKYEESPVANIVPKQLRVGDVVSLEITDVNKHGVVFDHPSIKQEVICSVNLWKYKKFREFTPRGTIDMFVTAITKDRVTVDPISPLVNKWISSCLSSGSFQRNINDPKVTMVKNLHLVKGGYMGQAIIPTVSEWIGEEYVVDAFIPGGQIILNIESDFEKWEGKTIETFITNCTQKPNSHNLPELNGKISLVCSRKKYLEFRGNINIINLFKVWCDGGKKWDEMMKSQYDGVITGVGHTGNICGVFVEVPSMNFNGMITRDPDQLTSYKPGTSVKVHVKDIVEPALNFENTTGQMVHQTPYQITDGCLDFCHLKVSLDFEDDPAKR